IESGKLELEEESVVLKNIVADMEELFSELAVSKEINFMTHVEPAVPRALITDLGKAEQVLKNLLSNAFKFTSKQGSVQLNVSLSEKSDFIAFTIKDSGIGISEDKQNVIFEAFKQA